MTRILAAIHSAPAQKAVAAVANVVAATNHHGAAPKAAAMPMTAATSNTSTARMSAPRAEFAREAQPFQARGLLDARQPEPQRGRGPFVVIHPNPLSIFGRRPPPQPCRGSRPGGIGSPLAPICTTCRRNGGPLAGAQIEPRAQHGRCPDFVAKECP